jgi:vacuolar iron transporter family protein
VVSAGSLVCLAALGAVAAGAGGASRVRGAVRVTSWSALALGVTALVGRLFGTTG